MFDLSNIPSMSTILSTYASVAASAVLVRTMASEFIPDQLHGFIIARLQNLFNRLSSSQGLLTVIIGECNNGFDNEVFEAAEIYLRSKISSRVEKFRVNKTRRDKNLLVGIERDEAIIDVFQGVEFKWKLNCTETKESYYGGICRSFELKFRMKHRDMVLESYLPFVLTKSKVLKEENKVVKLYTNNRLHGERDEGGPWTSINLEHPATFDKLAMDPELKKALIEDLDRFVKRREFYKKVGKAWKRGYLLYGPPGTGKSSLIAAMANYLNFHIYELELTSIHRNSDLPGLLVTTSNRSILVIEDIDCNVELQDREFSSGPSKNQLTLSGLLNFIDGLWSTCGDERIFVFTTNHKDRLDPALLRPGRMDMHIHMSYCTPPGFKLLASNYLGICDHPLFKEIEGLIEKVEVTPAEVAEQLMKSDDMNITLQSLIEFIRNKMEQLVEVKAQDKGNNIKENEDDEDDDEGQDGKIIKYQGHKQHGNQTKKRRKSSRLSKKVKTARH
ncbi:hypothetical protein NE237_031208 [Protea cynaroides]|uniref:AAA+ ATPase domain-containing protein n=1 Tax=Protea cynaroides TaxID=273540 RepID=A0A9Q0L1M9_9MAGN|nr:hypothetical protein NE237_031208 [Protea cynaroides]